MAKTLEKVILGVLLLLILGVGGVLVTVVATNTTPVEWVSSIRVVEKWDV